VGGVILLMGKGDPKQERVYYLRCLTACKATGLMLRTVDVGRVPKQKKTPLEQAEENELYE
jgi:hypothetical protein